MDIVLGILFAVVALAGIILIAKRFLKPVKGPLPDCCSIRGNRDLQQNKEL
jgi:hypothetical protein